MSLASSPLTTLDLSDLGNNGVLALLFELPLFVNTDNALQIQTQILGKSHVPVL